MILPTLDPPAPPKDGVWSWGHGGQGRLGTGNQNRRFVPSELVGLTNVTEISAGGGHGVARRSDGTARSWGYNEVGQVGDGSTTDRNSPVQVSSLTGVIAVAAGNSHTVALRTDGTVRGWGTNDDGVGDGTTLGRVAPVAVLGLTNITSIAAGAGHSLARRTDGTVRAWGSNFLGQLGDGSLVRRLAPVPVPTLANITTVSAGAFHSFALRGDGTVWAWGANEYGQLGDGTTTQQRMVPVRVLGLDGVTAIAGGSFHGLALRNNGTVWAWGDNNYGQLGDGTTTPRASPTQVSGLSNIVAIAAGASHSLALDASGTLWAWGDNAFGQLGDGSNVQRRTPVHVLGITNATRIAAGGFFSLAIGRVSPTIGVESFTTTVPAGATTTTDVELDGANAQDPIETTITSPFAGIVSVSEAPASGSFGDFSVAGRLVQITAPAATSTNQMTIRFRIDVSVFPEVWLLSSLNVYRNGAGVGSCGVVVDPCVESRTRFPDGDVEIVVRTSSASEWVVGRTSAAANAGGPYTAVEGAGVVLLGSAAGGEPPYSFEWLGAFGELSDFVGQSPTFTGRDDGIRLVSLSVTDAGGLVGRDETTITVANALPNVGTIAPSDKKLKVNTQIKVSAPFFDAGTRDTHTATWNWGDGKSSAAELTESNGSGTVTGNHVYKKTGSYTITLTVRDDDGGTQQRNLSIVVS